MNILTFDIEDWYCHDNYSQNFEWDKHEVRIYEPLEKILSCLDEKKVKGTFFCLGWLALRHPRIIKDIVNCGHQIGCHSFQHQLAYRYDRASFYADTYKAKSLIEDLIGQRITAFRAPSYSITSSNLYAFDVLSELGFLFDSSVFPTSRECGGFTEYGQAIPSIIKHNGFSIKEFPMNVYSLLGRNIVFSGGGYFRIVPYPFIQMMVRNSNYIVSYFHPSDFDPGQPSMGHLPLMRQLKNKVCLKNNFKKFERYIADNEFVNIDQADMLIDWSKVKVVELG